MKPVSVFIGIPSGSDWKADFGMCLAGLVAAAPKPLHDGSVLQGLNLWNTKGSILSRSRHTLVTKALESGASHILMLDSDMTFPNWTLHQLLKAEQDIVAANCVTKVIPANPTARQKGDTPAGVPLDSRGKKGLEKVWRVGTGVMLINLEVFKHLPQPWFPITWEAGNADYTGEDWNFCKLVQDNGFGIWVDHTLSQHIGHVGSFEFTMEAM